MIGRRLAPACTALALLTVLPLPASADGPEKRPASPRLEMHVVPLPVRSYRLLAMSKDEDGFVWAGSIHRLIHRYDPRTGDVQTIEMPSAATASSCICVGKKVYVLGQAYPRLIVYDRAAREFKEAAYPSDKPNVWYGTEAIDGRHLYLFDRTSAGVIKWDTQSDSGKVIPYPYKTPLPGGGRYESRDKALWCHVWDFTGNQYRPVGLARLDVAADKFTGWYPFPREDAELRPYADPATTFFVPYTLKGKVVPFDFKEGRWCSPLPVPEFEKRFAFMGGPLLHRGRWYFSLSTYNGTETGCDGKPYHFCNAVLEFDPATCRFDFLTLEARDAYYQIAYMLSDGKDFFATGTNIREPDGKLKGDRAGEVIFWQTVRPAKKEGGR
jgi:hypothetical protein